MKTYLDIEGTLRLTFYYLNGEEVTLKRNNIIFENLKSGNIHLDLRERTVYKDSRKMYTFNFEVLENTEYKFDRDSPWL